jgi:hypothetical protein
MPLKRYRTEAETDALGRKMADTRQRISTIGRGTKRTQYVPNLPIARKGRKSKRGFRLASHGQPGRVGDA